MIRQPRDYRKHLSVEYAIRHPGRPEKKEFSDELLAAVAFLMRQIDPAGNKGYVRDTDAFVETWIREKTRWRLSEARTLRHQRAAAGSPSPALMAQLDQMRTLNAQMRGFNAANNLSKCMHSNDLASLSLDEQRSRCSP